MDVTRYQGDVPAEYAYLARSAGVVAWDIETSGLDWQVDRIATCQLYVPNHPPVLVTASDVAPANLCGLLSDHLVTKIFHHAMFDLRFMFHAWGVLPQNISCTKIAAKLINPRNKTETSLKPLLKRYLNIEIDKTQQTSDWFSPYLTDAQVAYAVSDVRFLPELWVELERKLKALRLLELAYGCFAHIPTQVELDVLGFTRIYDY